MVNPYRSAADPAEHDLDSGGELQGGGANRGQGRDCCPFCGVRQSLFKAGNTIGRYRCPQCGERLMVVLPFRFAGLVFITMSTILIVSLQIPKWFGVRAPVGVMGSFTLLLMMTGVPLRHYFGVLRPVGWKWWRPDSGPN